ncbi:hypothetical protein LCGC14_1766040 [marine sediment metagenome]|uniref:Uncharacterized protein n=1 Tax=marine sediment metagenome TaxID=412755 RepID=A0A0F9HM68_9ZZZZ
MTDRIIRRAWSIDEEGLLVFPNTAYGPEMQRTVGRPVISQTSLKSTAQLVTGLSNAVQVGAPFVDPVTGAAGIKEVSTNVCFVYLRFSCGNPNCTTNCYGDPPAVSVSRDLDGRTSWDASNPNTPPLRYDPGATISIGPFPGSVDCVSPYAPYLFQGTRATFRCGLNAVATTSASITFTLPEEQACLALGQSCVAYVTAYYEGLLLGRELICPLSGAACPSTPVSYTITAGAITLATQLPDCLFGGQLSGAAAGMNGTAGPFTDANACGASFNIFGSAAPYVFSCAGGTTTYEMWGHLIGIPPYGYFKWGFLIEISPQLWDAFLAWQVTGIGEVQAIGIGSTGNGCGSPFPDCVTETGLVGYCYAGSGSLFDRSPAFGLLASGVTFDEGCDLIRLWTPGGVTAVNPFTGGSFNVTIA